MNRTQTVSDITRHIKSLIDSDEFLADLWVEGELSDFRRASSGHCYLTLKDSQCELRCVMWRAHAARLIWRPQPGDAVEIHGHISVYERAGVYQFYADTLLRGGIGDRWREFQALKSLLEAEGLFDASRKRPIPRWPRCIGVVTSATGAALQDILNVLAHRYPLVEVLLSPTLVQGMEAPASIVRAIGALNTLNDVDLVLIARGGGSSEDLWAFNDEGVARAVAGCRAPVITGIGHETDFTIADFCADLRAPTPSAAAAAAVPDRAELWDHLTAHMDRLTDLIAGHIAERQERTERLRSQLQRLDLRRTLGELRQRVDGQTRRARLALLHRLRVQQVRLAGSQDRLRALDPRSLLWRGYAIVQHRTTGDRVYSVAQVFPDDLLELVFADGRIGAQVIDVAGQQATLAEGSHDASEAPGPDGESLHLDIDSP